MTFEELPEPIPLGQATDYSGRKCGDLTILYRVPNTNKTHTRWACICSCGDYCIRDIDTLKRGIGKCDSPHNHNNLVGQKFGKLMPIHRLDDYVVNRGWMYECLCECGKRKNIREKDFKYGATVSCTCNKNEYNDLTGKVFGKLIAIEPVEGKRIFDSIVWKCRCECGEYTEVRSGSLTNGEIKSCGCLKSDGEYKIQQILETNLIEFESQKHNMGCNFPDTNKSAYFDFYIKTDKPFLLEFDGSQHECAGGHYTNENFVYIRNHDLYKNQWAWDNNIPLKRIPYKYKNTMTIDDILSDRFLITPTTHPKWYPKENWTYPYFTIDTVEELH